MFKQTIKKNGGRELMKIFIMDDESPVEYVNSFCDGDWIDTRTNFHTAKNLYNELMNENTEWSISYDFDDCILRFENQKGKYAEYVNIDIEYVSNIF